MTSTHASTLMFLIITFSGGSLGEKFSFGSCPTVTDTTLTTSNAPIGATAYEIASTHNLDRHGWTCVTWTTGVVTAGVKYTLNISGFKYRIPVSETATMTLIGGVAGTTFTGSIVISYNTGLRTPKEMTYSIIGHAAAYTVLYACENIGLGKIEDVIILTAARPPTGANLGTALGLVLTNLATTPYEGLTLLESLKYPSIRNC